MLFQSSLYGILKFMCGQRYLWKRGKHVIRSHKTAIKAMQSEQSVSDAGTSLSRGKYRKI